MESLHSELLYITDKFPGQSGKIAELYKNDSDFRALCEDYFLCIKILRQYQNEFGEKQNVIKEYEDTSKDLERELQDFLGVKK
jgi:hypothetical protein